MARCLLAACLALAAAATPIHAQNKNAAAEIDKTLDGARTQIDRVQKRLDAAPDKPLQDHDLVDLRDTAQEAQEQAQAAATTLDRNSGVEGKSVSVRVDLGGRRLIKNKNTPIYNNLKHYLNIKLSYHM